MCHHVSFVSLNPDQVLVDSVGTMPQSLRGEHPKAGGGVAHIKNIFSYLSCLDWSHCRSPDWASRIEQAKLKEISPGCRVHSTGRVHHSASMTTHTAPRANRAGSSPTYHTIVSREHYLVRRVGINVQDNQRKKPAESGVELQSVKGKEGNAKTKRPWWKDLLYQASFLTQGRDVLD